MLRTCGKGLIVAAGVASLGVAALVLIYAGCEDVPTSQNAPVFARIAVSGKSVVYIQIQSGELRAATSVEGLQTAAPVKSFVVNESMFGDVALPVPADQLPAGVTAIKMNLRLVKPWSYLRGQFTVSRTDFRKAQWQYVSEVGDKPLFQAGANAKKAPSIKMADLDNVKAVLATQPSKGRLAVALQIMAGDVRLTDVRKDGQPAQVRMVVTDAAGARIASKVGPLSDFGFS